MEVNWEWELPISVNLSSNPNKRFKFIARSHSYIHLYLPKILAFFIKDGNLSNKLLNKFWFSTMSRDGDTSIPVNWNSPIDVSLMMCGWQCGEWKITLNVSSYPVSLMPVPNLSKVLIDESNFETIDQLELDLKFLESNWLNRIKEACYIINGNSNIIMKMSRNDTNSWWDNGILKHDSTTFNKFFSRLLPANYENIKNLPCVIHFNEQILRAQIGNGNIRIQELLDNLSIPGSTVCINSIVIPMDSPLLEIYKILKSIDLSLHIFVY